jgi:3-hydroxyisobutyrate dehydrogenase
MSGRVAVLGLGIMGSALARRAAGAGLETSAWDRAPERASELGSAIRAAESAKRAVQGADVVVTMVPDADAVLDVMRTQGALDAMKPGAAWVQMSTIGVEGTDRAARLAATRPELVFVDAPVGGSKGPAEQGKLVVLASGDRTRAGETVQRFFDAVGSQTHWLGAAGQGTRMKLLLNAWVGVAMQGVAEVAALADALEVEPQRFAAVVTGGPLVPLWALQKLEKIITGTTGQTEFPLRWATKDIRLALAAAPQARSRLPILERIADVWSEAADFGADDLSAIYVALRQAAPDKQIPEKL